MGFFISRRFAQALATVFIEAAFEKPQVKRPLQVVPDGQETIDYLSGVGQYADRKRYPLLGLLLLDLKMPRKNGMEVLEWKYPQTILDNIPTVVFRFPLTAMTSHWQSMP